MSLEKSTWSALFFVSKTVIATEIEVQNTIKLKKIAVK
jgi:hypothetical protein